MKPLIIFGDSHAAVYASAASGTNPVLVGGPLMGANRIYEGRFVVEGGRWVGDYLHFDYNLARFLKVVGEPDLEHCAGRIVVSLGLSATPLFNMRSNGTHWLAFTSTTGFYPGKIHLSDGALRRIASDGQAEIIKLYDYGIDHGLFVAAVAPPPPPRAFANKYGSGFVCDLVRFFQEPVREHLAKRGLPIIEPPAATVNADGGLKDEFLGGDGFHGNDAYGGLIISEILELLRPADQR